MLIQRPDSDGPTLTNEQHLGKPDKGANINEENGELAAIEG
jgi:hypothetical protein